MSSNSSSPQTTFRTTIFSPGGTKAGIVVPPEAVEALGAGQRPPVMVTIGSYTYSSTVAVMGGQYLIGLSNEHRRASGISVGDEVEVTLQLEVGPRPLEPPADSAATLDAVPAARTFFDGLSRSVRQVHVVGVDGAKTAETRARRIAKSVEALAAGKPR
jgi:hypothetical protein